MKSRKLILTYSPDMRNKRDRFIERAKSKRYQKAFASRNIRFIIRRRQDRSQLFRIALYGYDGKLKYVTNKVNSIPMILKRVDAMPIRKAEMRKAKTQEKIKSIELYTDSHPNTTVRGTGYKDEEVAKKTLQKIRKLPKRRQYLIVHTLYYRAKFHPHPTPGMHRAMRLFKKWLSSFKK